MAKIKVDPAKQITVIELSAARGGSLIPPKKYRPLAVLQWSCDAEPEVMITKVFGDNWQTAKDVQGGDFTGPSPLERASEYLQKLREEGCPHNAYYGE